MRWRRIFKKAREGCPANESLGQKQGKAAVYSREPGEKQEEAAVYSREPGEKQEEAAVCSREPGEKQEEAAVCSREPGQYPEAEAYMGKLKEQIRNPMARKMAAEEIENHIADQACAYESQGMEREKAVEAAVRQMGDPVAVGVDLDRIHRPKMNWPLFGMIAAFSILGLILQYMCFYGLGEELREYSQANISRENFYRQCIYTFLGLGAMTGVCFLDYSRIGRHSRAGGLILLLGILMVCQMGGLHLVNGNRSWFVLFPMVNGGYPYLKCLLYLFVPLFGGILYKNRGTGYRGLVEGFIWIAALFPVGNWIGGGIGGTIDVILVCLVMLFMAVGKGWFKTITRKRLFAAAFSIMVLGGVAAGGNLRSYQLTRLQSLFVENNREGYLNMTVRRIMSNLSLRGNSTAVLSQKGLLPWQNIAGIPNDFIFLQMATQLGIIRMLCICGGLAALFCVMVLAVVRQKNQMGQMMGLGCVMLLALETVRTVFNNLGFYVASTNGLMFFSYGKVHTITVYILLGVVLSIYRYKDLVWEKEEKKTFKKFPGLRPAE
ncbi:MAG: FtsW/RodA/SpoVE family cell cycle protein [Hungatella sp.]|nr:FtsW/RodA/SpoVE family cell cycle protein [Hungatella sp.]